MESIEESLRASSYEESLLEGLSRDSRFRLSDLIPYVGDIMHRKRTDYYPFDLYDGDLGERAQPIFDKIERKGRVLENYGHGFGILVGILLLGYIILK